MHGSARVATLVLLSLGVGCGGAESPEISVRFQRQALLEQASLLAVYFYAAETECGAIVASLPRPPSLLGPFSATLDAASRQSGVLLRLDTIPVGEYVAFVDALDKSGRSVGTGCAPGQRVFERQVSTIQLVVSDSP